MMDLRRLRRLVLVGGALIIAPVAHAADGTGQNQVVRTAIEKEPSPTPSTSTTAVLSPVAGRPDIVRLKNGGVVRGTIDERMPDKYVVIMTPAGELRRFDWSEVEYAGAATDMPQAQGTPAPSPVATPNAVAPSPSSTETTRPAFTVQAAEAKVNFASKDGEPLLVYVHTNTAQLGNGGVSEGSFQVEGYRQLCTTPCNVTMAAGTYTFGVAIPGKKMRAAEPLAISPGDNQLTARIKSRTGLRVLGWTVAGIGTIVGAAMSLSASEKVCDDTSYGEPICLNEMDETMYYGGAVIILASVGLGVGLIFVHDSGEVSSGVPTPVAPARRRRKAWNLGLSPMMANREHRLVPSGMNLVLAF